MTKYKTILGLLFLLVMCSCASANTSVVDSVASPGFWWGLLHGWMVAFAFIVSLFDPTVGMYEVANNGGWYDFGFVLGIGAFSGSCSSCTR